MKNGSRLPLSEKAFAQQVVDLAQLMGWRCYRTHDSRRSPAGFPDLVLVKPPRLIFAELKTEIGKVTPDQMAWMHDLTAIEIATAYDGGSVVSCYLWRPCAWDEIERTLTGREGAST